MGPRAPLCARAVLGQLLFAVVLGLLGVTDMASWLGTSLPVFHEIRLQRRLGRLISDETPSNVAEARESEGRTRTHHPIHGGPGLRVVTAWHAVPRGWH